MSFPRFYLILYFYYHKSHSQRSTADGERQGRDSNVLGFGFYGLLFFLRGPPFPIGPKRKENKTRNVIRTLDPICIPNCHAFVEGGMDRDCFKTRAQMDLPIQSRHMFVLVMPTTTTSAFPIPKHVRCPVKDRIKTKMRDAIASPIENISHPPRWIWLPKGYEYDGSHE